METSINSLIIQVQSKYLSLQLALIVLYMKLCVKKKKKRIELPQIPIIDFSREDLKPGSSSWLSMRDQNNHALEDCGCFIAKYDQLSEKLLSQTRDMFELPTDIKKKNTNDEP